MKTSPYTFFLHRIFEFYISSNQSQFKSTPSFGRPGKKNKRKRTKPATNEVVSKVTTLQQQSSNFLGQAFLSTTKHSSHTVVFKFLPFFRILQKIQLMKIAHNFHCLRTRNKVFQTYFLVIFQHFSKILWPLFMVQRVLKILKIDK